MPDYALRLDLLRDQTRRFASSLPRARRQPGQTLLGATAPAYGDEAWVIGRSSAGLVLAHTDARRALFKRGREVSRRTPSSTSSLLRLLQPMRTRRRPYREDRRGATTSTAPPRGRARRSSPGRTCSWSHRLVLYGTARRLLRVACRPLTAWNDSTRPLPARCRLRTSERHAAGRGALRLKFSLGEPSRHIARRYRSRFGDEIDRLPLDP